VSGRVLDENGRPVPNTMIESCRPMRAGAMCTNMTSTTARVIPTSPARGRVITDAEGRYRFITIKPAPIPGTMRAMRGVLRTSTIRCWRGFAQRLITQMYFPGDPLFPLDAIANAVPEAARQRLVARFDLETTEPFWALSIASTSCCAAATATPMEH